MEGSSPFPYQSPSFHSSSYLPKLEANFMRDFRCCGLTLPSTHELLQHYEENHVQQMPETLRKQSTQLDPITAQGSKTSPESGRPVGANQDSAERDHPRDEDRSQPQTPILEQRSSPPTNPQITFHFGESVAPQYQPAPLTAGQDMDGLQDMEMDLDDAMEIPNDFQQQQYQMQDQPRMLQRSQFGQPAPNRVPSLNLNTMNMPNPIQQHQGLRNSTPSTPVGPGRVSQLYQNNPTVSSVNTPTLSTHPRHQQQYAPTPDSSVPGTPSDPTADFGAGVIPMCGPQYLQNQYPNLGNFYGSGIAEDMLDLCIDEPAKRMWLNGSKKYTKQSSSSQLGDGQYSENSELARTIREQQRLAGVPDPQTEGGVPKPFHCPVIGCEKAYKNQNGLKYHKAVCFHISLSVVAYHLTSHSMDIILSNLLPTRTVHFQS